MSLTKRSRRKALELPAKKPAPITNDFADLSPDIIREVIACHQSSKTLKEFWNLRQIAGPWGDLVRDYQHFELEVPARKHGISRPPRLYEITCHDGLVFRNQCTLNYLHGSARIRSTCVRDAVTNDVFSLLPYMIDALKIETHYNESQKRFLESLPDQFSKIELDYTRTANGANGFNEEIAPLLRLLKFKNLRKFECSLHADLPHLRDDEEPLYHEVTLNEDDACSFVAKPQFERLFIHNTVTNGLKVVDTVLDVWRKRKFFEVGNQYFTMRMSDDVDLKGWVQKNFPTMERTENGWLCQEQHRIVYDRHVTMRFIPGPNIINLAFSGMLVSL
ncbi:hypothetical protein QR680_004101 [Steinernema hermaphroditum]|uniref:Uncharacterized protein n=1 Tax=Steinernema hermaphroditum TaxID=289476 RepID=A0AA39HNQ1_9BILA|nr:hypothetical protein QR680_004101 [Steinernema hermaphroditum]